MTKKKLPDWKTFKETGFIYTEREQDYLRAIYNNLNDETWNHFVLLYGSEKMFLEAFGRFSYWFVKYQNEKKQPFNPVEWFKYQHDLANKLKEAVEKSDLDTGLQTISDFEKNYENEVVFNLLGSEDYYKILSRDFCELLGEFEKSWDFHSQMSRNQGLYVTFRYLKIVSPKPLNAEIIIASFGEKYLGLTNYGLKHIDLVKKSVNQWLEDYYEEYGNNPLCRIVSECRESILKGENFNDLSSCFDLYEDFERSKNQTMNYLAQVGFDTNTKTSFYLFSEPWFKKLNLFKSPGCDYFPIVLNEALTNYFISMFRNAENDVRKNEGVPKIGEGWVSETELFNSLKKTFSNFKIIQHATPNWLNGQHFDVYFPNEKIAIEYHGKQHFEPVEFFGGEENFEKQKERDLRKIKLAESNGCELIIVKKGYDFELITKQIESLIG